MSGRERFWTALAIVAAVLAALLATAQLVLTLLLISAGSHCERYTAQPMVAGKAIVIQQQCAEWSEPK